jgi:hypothetical protein
MSKNNEVWHCFTGVFMIVETEGETAVDKQDVRKAVATG